MQQVCDKTHYELSVFSVKLKLTIRSWQKNTKTNIPIWITKDELSQLEISQHYIILVAVLYCFCHLSKQSSSILFRQAFPSPSQVMQIVSFETWKSITIKPAPHTGNNTYLIVRSVNFQERRDQEEFAVTLHQHLHWEIVLVMNITALSFPL